MVGTSSKNKEEIFMVYERLRGRGVLVLVAAALLVLLAIALTYALLHVGSAAASHVIHPTRLATGGCYVMSHWFDVCPGP
jgi:hypothetical protein